MKIKVDLSILVIIIMLSITAGIIMSSAMVHIICSSAHKNRIDNPALRKVSGNDNHDMKKMFPITKNGEISDVEKQLLLINVIQRVLENTIKTNSEIVFMSVYSDDGTIIAHFKPERIGKNMFDVDVEFGDFLQDIFEAMTNRTLYKGVKYDPLLNDNMRFIVKPFQVSNLTNNLSLLIGISVSYIRETETITMFTEQ